MQVTAYITFEIPDPACDDPEDRTYEDFQYDVEHALSRIDNCTVEDIEWK